MIELCSYNFAKIYEIVCEVIPASNVTVNIIVVYEEIFRVQNY